MSATKARAVEVTLIPADGIGPGITEAALPAERLRTAIEAVTRGGVRARDLGDDAGTMAEALAARLT